MPDWKRVTVGLVPENEKANLPRLSRSLAHICLRVADLERSIRFYRDILGLSPVFQFFDENKKRFGIYFHFGDRNFLELFENPGEKGPKGSFLHFCIETQDLDATVAEIAKRGCPIDRPPQLGCDGTRQAWIKDPDGNPIEIFCYTDKSLLNPWLE